MDEFPWMWLLRRKAASVLLSTALAMPAAFAHHSPARFDQSRTITIDGVVAQYDWANPHVYISIDQVTEAGETVTWEIEAQPPAIMRRGGWSPETLRVGDVVSVSGNPGRGDAGRILYLASMQRADHALYDQQRLVTGMSNAGSQPEFGASSLDGIWATLLSWPALQPFVQPIEHMQLTDAGAAAVASYDESTMNPALECVPFPAPYLMVATDTKRISTRDGAVVIEGEHDGSVRTVHMDVATHEGPLSIHGHSIGRWDDDILVIDTAQFAPHRVGGGIGLPSGSQKRLVEWLTLAKDGKSLTYRYELTDPEFIAAPVTGEVAWAYRPDFEYAPVPCDLEVARRFTE